MPHTSDVKITESMVKRFHELNLKAKEIEDELSELKKKFNHYFDHTLGENAKGEWAFGHLKLQRQIRKSEKFNEEKTVKKLEELNLLDCIETVKKPNKEKINAAVTLGLLSPYDLEECLIKRVSKVIVVRKQE
ncbi:hypothetical protein JOD45_000148 [Scopulibacillus daqui]|uniref:Gam-like protein n=1 Tax=Scopulibacillus daqui TaxID=1469162 RepID=A0ABS2PXC3_9BACL|nr:hypothetical protein [Scopulibacillus daqui]MBM7643957.1 hypothetical protein [Scopulibacillus daqui]